MVLSLLVTVVLARTLGPKDYGLYAYVFSLVSFLAVPIEYGLPSLVIRETAKGELTAKWNLVKGVWRWSNIATILYSFLVASALGISIFLFSSHFSSGQIYTLAWGAFLLLFMSLCKMRGAALRGLRHVVIGQFPDAVLRPLFLIVCILGLVFLWPSHRLTAAYAMMLHGLAGFMAFFVATWILWKIRPNLLREYASPIYKTRVWTKATFSLALLAGTRFMSQHVGILALGFFVNQADVGIFKVAAQGGVLAVFGVQAANMTIAPHFARLYAAGDYSRLQRAVTLSGRASFAIALPIVLIFFLWGRQILSHVFGPAFVAGYIALVIVAAGQLSSAVMGAVAYLLNMTGHERDVARSVAIAVVCDIGLNFVLIPLWGINGAAAAMALSFVLWNGLLWRAAKKRLGIDSFSFARLRTKLQ
ncbi:MAG: polysaccharide biosynthesis C-terminal domain-containing protein [Candidatus Micrarchaeaceae archaeon]